MKTAGDRRASIWAQLHVSRRARLRALTDGLPIVAVAPLTVSESYDRLTNSSRLLKSRLTHFVANVPCD